MKIHNVSGTLEEATKIISRMSPEERSEFYKEMFQYEPSRPYVEKAPANPVVSASSASL